MPGFDASRRVSRAKVYIGVQESTVVLSDLHAIAITRLYPDLLL